MRCWIAGVAALLLAPLLLVDIPPLLDYPNHLARLFLLAHGRDDAILAPMFMVRWGVIPNLAIDLIGPPLIRWLPVHIAGRLLLAMVLLLPFAGVLALQFVLFRRVHPWALASALILPSGAFLLGFLNFIAGLGGALLLAAWWIGGRERRPVPTVVVAMAGSAALFFCHLMGVLFALVLIFAWEARSPRRLAVAALVALPPGLLYLAAPLGEVAGGAKYLSLAVKLGQVMAPFVSYNAWLDGLTAIAVAGFVIACAVSGRLEAPRGIRWALAALAGLYAVSPYAFKGTYWLDTRFAAMFALLLFAGVRPKALPRSIGVVVLVVFVGLLVARSGLLAEAWAGHNRDIAELRTVIAPVRPGTRVFVTSVAPDEAPDYWARAPLARRFSNGIRSDDHLPALLLIERRAFWPLLFDDPSQQPVRYAREYRALAGENGGLLAHRQVGAAMLCGYDFVLLLGAGGEPDLAGFAGGFLTLEKATDAAALFRVRTGALPCPTVRPPVD